MASQTRRQQRSVEDILAKFSDSSLYIIVKQLELLINAPRSSLSAKADNPVIKFKANLEQAYPEQQLADYETSWGRGITKEGGVVKQSQAAITLSLNFYGLLGFWGVLPEWLKTKVLLQSKQNQQALVDLLDIFFERMVLLYINIKKQHDFYHNSQLALPLLQKITGTSIANDSQHACFFLGKSPHHEGLASLLTKLLNCPVQLAKPALSLIKLSTEQASILGGTQHAQLGVDVAIGDYVWGAPKQININIGPLSFQQFCALAPNTKKLKYLSYLIKQSCGYHAEVVLYFRVSNDGLNSIALGDSNALGWSACLGQTHGQASLFCYRLGR